MRTLSTRKSQEDVTSSPTAPKDSTGNPLQSQRTQLESKPTATGLTNPNLRKVGRS